MQTERYTNRLIRSQMQKNGLSLEELDGALAQATQDLAGQDYVLNHREILNAVFSYRKGGSLLDLGGSGNLYHLVLKHLGMQVEIMDFDFNQQLKPILEKQGIVFTPGNLYQTPFGDNKYDVISTFECFEHLPHSPKPIMDKVIAALKSGGTFVMSIPNVVRFDQRMRVLLGKTPHEKYEYLYHSGEYFAGHHREMTIREVKYLLAQNALSLKDIFTTDMTVQSAKKRPWLKRKANYLNYRYLLTDALMPARLRKHIWAKGTKAA